MTSVSQEIPSAIQAISQKTLALRLQIKRLEAELDEQEASLYKEMETLNITKFTTEYGGYTTATRSTWKYSPAVKELSEKLDVLKKNEENQGIATATTKTSYKYVPANTNF